MVGTERSLQDAYRRYRESQARSGVDPARRRLPRNAPGSWTEAASRWRWLARARAWDDDERARVRKAHFEAVRKMNVNHQTLARGAFNKVLMRLNEVNWKNLTSPVQFVSLLRQTIDLERLVMGMPVGIEVTHRNGSAGDATDFEQATQEASEEAARRFEASPQMFAAVMQVLAVHEVKPDPDADGHGGAAAEEPARPDGAGADPTEER